MDPHWLRGLTLCQNQRKLHLRQSTKPTRDAPCPRCHCFGTSLHRLSVENPWFATRPLLWTSQHLDLLAIRFHHVNSRFHAAPLSGITLRDLDEEEVFYEVRGLANRPYWTSGTDSYYFVRDNICFYFAKRGVHKTSCTPPVIGYMCYMTVARERERLLTPPPHPNLGYNWTVKQKYDRRLGQTTPDSWFEDPYLVCLLLSLAQAQRCKDKSGKPAIFPVRLFVTKDKDKTFAHVFHADINGHMLDALDEPTLDLNGVEWPTITHSQIPFEPYLTFPDRIMAELLGS
ncbi:uncharacterized protein BKA55DRAFT_661889 [Fusarium redolens]|uniref:Uncharacterized protein n=1 Tax=Fusarium redolens TaxID=48865 RepID=A0A9P9KE43_FUSRE|nr:uncharacterized protein BKA55DRAFT_661889 [Fusarium redolens]KAH7259167.1 hypothetical protein BKA55DRAFT_661889 [Fusarium redolens]